MKELDPVGGHTLAVPPRSANGTACFKAIEFFQRNSQGTINYHCNVDMFALGLTFLAMIQGNKYLVPQIETPNDYSELCTPIGELLAERIKYGTKPLNGVPKLRKDKTQLSETDSDREAASEEQPRDIRELVQRITCVVPEERISAVEVVQVLQKFIPVSFNM